MFVELGTEIEAMGCDSICIKDMAGLLPPSVAYEIVRGLKARVKIPVVVHTHDTAGFGVASYYAAIEAGADVDRHRRSRRSPTAPASPTRGA